jgi:multicomponent Na+:H+ antiporter subunit B
VVSHIGPAERHVTNMVSAVNFDIRGFDTLGEEVMLMTAVTGIAVLLRSSHTAKLTTQPATVRGRDFPPHGDPLRLITRLFAPMTILFGLYVVLHATVTPGGGFQGGVIVASGLLLLYFGERYETWQHIMRPHLLDALEGGGVALYVAAGLPPLIQGGSYLQNILPFGQMKAMLSGGMMLVLNFAVALAVAGGFGLLFFEFLKEMLAEEKE